MNKQISHKNKTGWEINQDGKISDINEKYGQKKINKWQRQKVLKNANHGAQTHNHKVKSLVFYQLS
jgi:hypothetical protein